MKSAETDTEKFPLPEFSSFCMRWMHQKNDAWEFVKYYLLHGYNKQGFPTLKEQFELNMLQAMEKDYVVEEEESYEMPKGTYMDIDTDFEVFSATQKDVEAIKQLVNSAENKFMYHTEVKNIINEEAEAYFMGQKEKEEVTENIQNRVKLYLEEAE